MKKQLNPAEILILCLIIVSILSSCSTQGAGRGGKHYKPTYASKAFSQGRFCHQ